MTPKISDFQSDFKLFKAHLYPTTQDVVLVSHRLYNACASVREMKYSLLMRQYQAGLLLLGKMQIEIFVNIVIMSHCASMHN